MSRFAGGLAAALFLAVAATACTQPMATLKPSPASSTHPSTTPSTTPTMAPSSAPSTAASAAPSAPATPGVVSFKADVAPLLSSSCAGCHMPGGAGSGDVRIFDASDAVVYANVKSDLSTIIRQVQSGRMPQGRPHLTADEVAVLTGWQKAGAPEN